MKRRRIHQILCGKLLMMPIHVERPYKKVSHITHMADDLTQKGMSILDLHIIMSSLYYVN